MKISPNTVSILALHSDIQAKAIITHNTGEQVYTREGRLSYMPKKSRRETQAYYSPVPSQTGM